jgi:glucokinase
MVDGDGHILCRCTEPVDSSSSAAPIRQIVELAKKLGNGTKIEDSFCGAGIAVPGLVRRDGTVWAPNLPGWKRMPLASRLGAILKIPVFVESDRNAAVLGECWRGAGQGKTDVAVVMIGTGIGAGILSGGRILRGAHELSGCAGWLTVGGNELPQARIVGHLESLAAGPGIARVACNRIRGGERSSLARLDLRKITAHEVADAARHGDRLARDVFSRAGKLLGFAIANIISLLDPQVVVIGGGMAGAADLYMDSLRDAMRQRAQPLAARQVKITITKLGDAANLIGCARLSSQL